MDIQAALLLDIKSERQQSNDEDLSFYSEILKDNIYLDINPEQGMAIKKLTDTGEEEALQIKNNFVELPKDYKYYDYACDIHNDIKDYSLDLQYNLESGLKYIEGLNSVTVITRSQTISTFNDDTVNGLKGSGHHEANFDKIIETVYGRKFMNSMSGQDIRIRHIAQINNNTGKLEFKMAVDMPYVINSSQYESLSNLNNEIKRIENNLGIIIEVHTVMTDFENRDFVKFIENKTNFDEVLNTVAIDDVKEDKYQEVCYIGYSNLENHYNDIKYVR